MERVRLRFTRLLADCGATPLSPFLTDNNAVAAPARRAQRVVIPSVFDGEKEGVDVVLPYWVTPPSLHICVL